MTISVRNHDVARIVEALSRTVCTAAPDSLLVGVLADLIDDIRHETIDHCRAQVDKALVFVSNGAMTPERMRRMVETHEPSSTPIHCAGTPGRSCWVHVEVRGARCSGCIARMLVSPTGSGG